MKKSTRLSLDVSPELNETLDEISKKTHASKSEVLRKSIALMEVAVREKELHHHLAVINNDNQVVKEIIGL